MPSFDSLPHTVTLYLRDDQRGLVPDWAIEPGATATMPTEYLEHARLVMDVGDDGRQKVTIHTTQANAFFAQRQNDVYQLSIDADFHDARGGHILIRAIVYRSYQEEHNWEQAMLGQLAETLVRLCKAPVLE